MVHRVFSRHQCTLRSNWQHRIDINVTLEVGMRSFFGIGLACGLLVASVGAHAFSGEQLAKRAKVGIAEARSIALKAHPGKIVDEELEREDGGTGLRYSFDIRTGRATQEVGVDAQDGTVLENKLEGPNPD
ncbi:PepSY domain-containing protein [Paraburkholderia dilworthii]|uniref:PepSY domain-containing protein n=1 Tax=Paraburkholderia dilworthii TaxID=948106 RepID=A0ABW9DFU4_9BURK